MYFIIRNKNDHEKLGRTRSEQEENIRKEWGPTITDEQLDKLKFIEKKHKDKTGSKKNFIGAADIDLLDGGSSTSQRGGDSEIKAEE